jgi:anti-anti-sigma regulatory factor
VAFSLFGKKPEPPAKPAAKKAAPAAPAPARPAAPKPTPEPPPPPKEELESLDFTAPGAIEVHEEDQSGHFEIRESSATMHPVVEEAAILFANGQDEAALATLESAVEAGGLGAAADQVWAMVFDLYQILGKRDLFDKRALDYSMKYEKSPPTWVEQSKQSLGPALTTGGTAFVAFTGTLGESAEKTVKQLEKIVSGNPVARVEFGKLQNVDPQGAEMLLKAMQAARKAKCELVMSGAEKLAELLKAKLEVGKREDEMIWMLLLELYQHMAQQDPFEEWAVNYAVTFEVSPPSWENRPPPKKPAAMAATAATAAEPDVFPLAGEMYSAGSDAFRQLVDFATGREQVLVDCSALKRMDFVSAGLFLNTLTNLQITGCSVTIRNPNQLLFALFGVLGINQVAHVERRKF